MTQSITVSPAANTAYKLQVIPRTDGYIDYDEATVNVSQYYINTMSPNPTGGMVTITYNAAGAATAFVSIIQPGSTNSATYSLDVTANSVDIDLSSFPTGIYTVVLICDGQAVDARGLFRN